jgi:trehalose/maltose hydrolase-like predicted phosphorylase
LRNNAYTNVLVAWLCGIAGQLLPLLPASRAEALRTRLGIGDDELAVFLVALHSDADDIQGGTTKEGIHMGVMAGTLDLMQRNYVGAHVYDGVLHFNPQLPSRLDSLSFSMQFRETPIQVTLTRDHLTLAVHPEGASRPSGSQSATISVSSARATRPCSSSAGTRRPPGPPPKTEKKAA